MARSRLSFCCNKPVSLLITTSTVLFMDTLCQHFRFGVAQIERGEGGERLISASCFKKAFVISPVRKEGGLGFIRQEKLQSQ